MLTSTNPDAIVVGGGLAGGCTAYSLARRGMRVQLLEAENSLCQKASGNRFGLLTPYITTRPSPLQIVYATGFSFSQSLLNPLSAHSDLFKSCGALQLPTTARLKQTLLSENPLISPPSITRVSAPEASDIAGIKIDSGALYIRDAGYLSPSRLIHDLIALYATAIKISAGSTVSSITRTANFWSVQTSDGALFSAKIVVLCAAHETSNLSISSWLPLEPVRGQTISMSANKHSRKLRTILCFGGYAIPRENEEHFVGAHYRHNDLREESIQRDTDDILATCSTWVPSLQFCADAVRAARVCFRTSTVDRLPYIGALPDFPAMHNQAASYRSGTNLRDKIAPQHLEGLFVNVGHGSRGLLTCPMGAEIIARLTHNEPLSDLSQAALECCPSRLPLRLLRSESITSLRDE